MTTIIIGAIGFMMLFKISRPLNSLRLALIISMIALFAVGGFFLSDLFTLSPLSPIAVKMTVAIIALAVPVMTLLAMITRAFELRGNKRRRRK
ncbi:MAG: hypothetical protein GX936_04080 [Clostridiales bacterium]|nr:hypothetical protein [Clostridiales bacterium]